MIYIWKFVKKPYIEGNLFNMKNINSLGLFDDHFLMEKLTKLGDPLQKLSKYIDWEIFENPLNDAFSDPIVR